MECTEKKKKIAEPKNSPLTVDDVCRILKASEESGVTKLKFRELVLERQIVIAKLTQDPTHTENAIPPETHKKQNDDALLVDELRVKQDQLQELVFTDPFELERMIADGELVPDEVNDGDSD